MEFAAILEISQEAVHQLDKPWDPKLEAILRYCTQSPGWSGFPKVGSRKADPGDQDNMRQYLRVYLERYFRARGELLVLRGVGTLADPAVDVILRAFAHLKEDLSIVSQHHRQSMAAENLLGELLERYIAQHLESQGWIWCSGNTIRAVDFLRADLSVALQIKNRSNSENSSSSAIRKGTEIQKWYRINAQTGQTNWNRFPNQPNVTFSEEDFHRFIEDYAKRI